MYFNIRRRSTKQIVENGFANRQEGKQKRDQLNKDFYRKKKKAVPKNECEYYIVRSKNHWKGASK